MKLYEIEAKYPYLKALDGERQVIIGVDVEKTGLTLSYGDIEYLMKRVAFLLDPRGWASVEHKGARVVLRKW